MIQKIHIFSTLILALFAALPIIAQEDSRTPHDIPLNTITSVSWSPDGLLLATANNNGSIQIRDAMTGTTNYELITAQPNPISTVAWNPDGTQIAATVNENVYIWERGSWRVLHVLQGFLDPVWAIAWNPDGTLLAGVSNGRNPNPNFLIWNLSTGQLLQEMEYPGTFYKVAWSPDGLSLATTAGTRVQLWDISQTTQQGFLQSVGEVVIADWNPDGSYLAVAGEHNTISIWNVALEQIIRELEGHQMGIPDLISDLDWSPDGLRLASVATDGTVRVWDALTGQEQAVIIAGSEVYSVAWSPDGSKLAYGGENGLLAIEPAPGNLSCEAAQTISAGDVTGFINAINTANSNPDADVIGLEAGTYTFTTAHIPLNALPAISSGITILGNGATLTRQAGSPLFGFFEVNTGGSLTLDNLTLNGGDVGNDTGGALVNEGGMVTLNNVTFSNNHANTGGAIDNESGSLTLIDSTFENNQADYGGAIDNDTGGTLSISGSTFTGNTADLDGGAIHNDGGTLTVTDSIFTSNTASRYGGALDNTGLAVLSGSTFSGNSASWSGGAIRNTNILTLTDSVFSGNSATSSYGSLYLTSSSTTTAHNSCFSGNSATSVGFTGTTMQDFTGNWWGAADGPSGSGPGSGDAVNNRISYASFLTTGCPHP